MLCVAFHLTLTALRAGGGKQIIIILTNVECFFQNVHFTVYLSIFACDSI